MKEQAQKTSYEQPEVRVIKFMIKNPILSVSSYNQNASGSVEDPRLGGHISIGRTR